VCACGLSRSLPDAPDRPFQDAIYIFLCPPPHRTPGPMQLSWPPLEGARMNRFDPETVAAMRNVLEEVCSHIPAGSTSARTFVAVKILECASHGKQSHELLLDAGRRAVIDQFGNVDAVRSLFR
jgi:hypothetical protein